MTSKANDANAGSTLSDEDIIERFGGIRPMAAKLGVAVTTVQGWKIRGHFPDNRREEILAAAAAHGIDLEGTASAPAEPQKPAATGGTQPASAAEFPQRAAPREAPEPANAAARPQEAAPAAAGRGGGLAIAALALAALAVAGVLTLPLWGPRLYPGTGGPAAVDTAGIDDALRRLDEQGRSRDEALQARLTALEAGGGEAGAAIAGRLGGIEQGVAGLDDAVSGLDDAVSGLERRLAALEAARGEVPEAVAASLREIASDTQSLRAEIAGLRQQLDAQEKTLADGLAGLRNDAAALDRRVAELEARPVQTGEKIAALALAVGQVEAALDTGLPYRDALDRLTMIAGDDPMVQGGIYRLSQWSDSGIQPLPALQRRFAEVAPSIDRALADTGGDSWLERTWQSVTTVVTVRRVEGEGTVSPVSKAEAALADGDLAGAVAALDAAGPLGEDGAAWVADARARLFAESELQALYAQVIAPLANSSGAAGR